MSAESKTTSSESKTTSSESKTTGSESKTTGSESKTTGSENKSGVSLNLHGTITTNNYDQACEATAKYGPLRVELSLHLRDILTDLGIVWALDGGTLLGAHRDGTMIPHDDDFDMVIYNPWLDVNSPKFEEESVQALETLKKLVENRLPEPYQARVINTYAKKVEVYNPYEGCYPFRDSEFPGSTYHNVTCDLTLLLRSPIYPDILLFQHINQSYTKLRLKPFFPLSKIKYEGHMYNAPGDPKAYLEDSYGYVGSGACFNKGTGYYEPRVGGEGTPDNWTVWANSPVCVACKENHKDLCTCTTCKNVHDTRECECTRKLQARE